MGYMLKADDRIFFYFYLEYEKQNDDCKLPQIFMLTRDLEETLRKRRWMKSHRYPKALERKKERARICMKTIVINIQEQKIKTKENGKERKNVKPGKP